MPGPKSITIGIGVSNAESALKWYTSLLGELEVLEPVPGMFELKLTETTWLQLDDTGYLEPGGKSTVIRFETTDIEASFVKAKSLAVKIENINVVEGLVKYFDFEDPSGNRLSFVELLG